MFVYNWIVCLNSRSKKLDPLSCLMMYDELQWICAQLLPEINDFGGLYF